jgi:hypothetical protein
MVLLLIDVQGQNHRKAFSESHLISFLEGSSVANAITRLRTFAAFNRSGGSNFRIVRFAKQFA